MACRNRRRSNPLPRRGGSERRPGNVRPAHAAVCSEAVEGRGRDAAPEAPPERDRVPAHAADRNTRSLVWREL